MNIEFLVDKEKERVIVSNEKGVIKPRKYQDNIKDILILEDVIEEQEKDLTSKRDGKDTYNRKMKDIDLKIEKEKNSWKSFKKLFLIVMGGVPIFLFIIFIFCEWLVGNEIAQISIQQIIDVLKLGAMVDVIGTILASIMMKSEDSCLSRKKRLNKNKLYIEDLNRKLELKISLLEKIIEKNKEELEYLEKQKEKTNIQNMSEEIQKVSYHNILERQKEYLIEMYEMNKISKKETTTENQSLKEQQGTILGRFKKKKEY